MLKVIGVGDNVCDQYLSLETIFPGGCTLNFAVYAAMQGAESAFMGCFGDDIPAQVVQSALKNHDIDFSRCRYYPGENGRAQVTLKDGERIFVRSNRMAPLRKHPLVLSEEDLSYLDGFDLIHVSCYSFMDDNLSLLKPLKPFVSYDFSNRFTRSDLEKVCPHVDCAIISCGSKTEEQTGDAIKMIHELGCPMALASLGEGGALLSYKGVIRHQPAHLVKALDTLGAGDAFLTTFLVSFLDKDNNKPEEEKIAEALDKAADFAARICMIHGAFGEGARYTDTELEAPDSK